MGVIHKFSVCRNDDFETPAHLRARLSDLRCWRDYYIEFEQQPDAASLQRVANALANGHVESVTIDAAMPSDAVQVSYHRGIVDNESDSICEMAALVGVPALAARLARVYQSSSRELVEVIGAEARNPNIETLHETEPELQTLLPLATYEAAQWFDVAAMDDEQLIELGSANGRSLELEKMRLIAEIQTKLGSANVSDALLESLDARWSDHCAHTTWKAAGNLLKVLMQSSSDTNNKNIVSMFYDNAGIWDFYDGYGIALKAETHNGPTAVSAYFGQLTKIGGVLRDILGTGKGADPIGVFEYTATGVPGKRAPIDNRPNPHQIANETIRAVKEYGNTFGVPMMQSKMEFNDSYSAKPFALGGSIGLIPNAMAEQGKPQVGDMALIIGGLTGNDGIHGASASSAGAQMDTTSVQIGSPLEEIKFREAILELRDAGLIRAITDMGAAGVNSAFGEMGEDVGIWINTAVVPLKTSGLAMWRILISESQERMALAVAPENLSDAREILDKHRVRNAVIGRFTGTQRFAVVHEDKLTQQDIVSMDVSKLPEVAETGFDLPYELVTYRPAQIEVAKPRAASRIESSWENVTFADCVTKLAQVAGDARVCSQRAASMQYDSSVGGRTHYGPFTKSDIATGYWAAKPLYTSDAAVVFASSFTPNLFEFHPVLAARQTLVAALIQQVVAGVALTDVCLSDNFYTPHLIDQANEWLAAMVHELADDARIFGTPFISGKDSSAGSTNTRDGVIHVPPAVFIAALGKVPDAVNLRPETWTKPGNLLVQVGLETPSIAGTVAADVFGSSSNEVDEIDVFGAKALLDSLQQVSLDVSPSARMIGSGGLAATAMKGALDSGLGVRLAESSPQMLLAENRCCALLEVSSDCFGELPVQLNARVVGEIIEGPPSVKAGDEELLSDAVRDAYFNTFTEVLA